MIRSYSIVPTAFFFVFGALAPSAACETADCPDLSEWLSGPRRFTLGASYGDGSPALEWAGELAEDEALEARIEETGRSGAEAIRSELGVVAGTVLLLRGASPATEPPIDRLDRPFLHLQLAAALLARVFPGGPTTVPSDAVIDLNEPKADLTVATASGVARITAPWHLTGTAGTGEGAR